MSYSRIAPKGCTCGDFWMMRHAHKHDCPIVLRNRKPDNHRLHITKDMFDSDCRDCMKAAQARQSHWENAL
jgi:hypothetical protein